MLEGFIKEEEDKERSATVGSVVVVASTPNSEQIPKRQSRFEKYKDTTRVNANTEVVPEFIQYMMLNFEEKDDGKQGKSLLHIHL